VLLISSWQKSVRRKWFVLAVYQFWKGISAGPALKYFTWFIGAGGLLGDVIVLKDKRFTKNSWPCRLSIFHTVDHLHFSIGRSSTDNYWDFLVHVFCFSPLEPSRELEYTSEHNIEPLNLIIEHISLLWNIIFTFKFTSAWPQCNFSILGQMGEPEMESHSGKEVWKKISSLSDIQEKSVSSSFRHLFLSVSFVGLFGCYRLCQKKT